MHILKPDEARWTRTLARPFAAVTVEVVGRRPLRQLRVVPGSFCVARAGEAQFVRLPEDIVLLSPEDVEDRIEPSRGFWISVDTIDPYHLVLDAPDDVFR